MSGRVEFVGRACWWVCIPGEASFFLLDFLGQLIDISLCTGWRRWRGLATTPKYPAYVHIYT